MAIHRENKGLKVYDHEKDVYQASQERINFIFDNFESIYVSFSGGKDSSVTLHQCIDIARKRGRRFGVMIIDIEAHYTATVEHAKKLILENLDVIEPYWIALPMTSTNAHSYETPLWCWYDPECKESWVRQPPSEKELNVITLENNPIYTYVPKMWFESFVDAFSKWYCETHGGKKTACLLGLRAGESFNRYLTIVGHSTAYPFRDPKTNEIIEWSSSDNNQIFNFYPIYDWEVEDIWKYNAKFNKSYNSLYDMMYTAGVPLHTMRVDEPLSAECGNSLRMFRILEPDTWMKVCGRVKGANFGAHLSNDKFFQDARLPKGHTWKSFVEFLLDTLPKNTAGIYMKKFTKYIRAWCTEGCVVDEKTADILRKGYMHKVDSIFKSRRSVIGSMAAKFNTIFDERPDPLKVPVGKDLVPAWQNLARVISLNDIGCIKIGFTYQDELMKKQKDLLRQVERANKNQKDKVEKFKKLKKENKDAQEAEA